MIPRLKIRKTLYGFFVFINIQRFWIKKLLLGFDVANQFIQRVDKKSLISILRKNGAVIGKNCDIETGLIFHNCKNYSNLTIGGNCHIGKNCFFDLSDKITIDDNVTISMQSTFITHLDVGKSNLKNQYGNQTGSIRVQNNTYVGARSVILSDVVIGESVFVASGALVNTDFTKRSFVAGVPAVCKKKIN